jgi:purine-binding chemotaxis protein CheW
MTQSHLIFFLNGLQYGIDTSVIKEVFLLPEITSIDNAPQDIIGVLNLRSQIVPIMDLNLRFGHPLKRYDINNEVIVIQWQKWRVGLIVDRIIEVEEISSEIIDRDTSYGRNRDIADVFVAGTIEVDNVLVMLLDPETLIRHTEAIENINAAEINEYEIETKLENIHSRSFYEYYFSNITDSEQKILQQRATNLKSVLVEETFGELLPLAVVKLGREYYGFTLDLVQEFIKVREIYPIPCCPPTLLGNTNWRGDIVTLINLANALKIEQDKVTHEADTVVVKIDDIVTGFPVDEVLDVMYLPFAKIQPNIALGNEEIDRYLLGTTFYEDKPMTILDLNKVILQQL